MRTVQLIKPDQCQCTGRFGWTDQPETPYACSLRERSRRPQVQIITQPQGEEKDCEARPPHPSLLRRKGGAIFSISPRRWMPRIRSEMRNNTWTCLSGKPDPLAHSTTCIREMTRSNKKPFNHSHKVVVVVPTLKDTPCLSMDAPVKAANYGDHVPVDVTPKALHLCAGHKKKPRLTHGMKHTSTNQEERTRNSCPHSRMSTPTGASDRSSPSCGKCWQSSNCHSRLMHDTRENSSSPSPSS